MTDTAGVIAESYVRLGLALEHHIPGYVDAYYGPPAWRDEDAAAGQQPIAALAARADDLAQAIGDAQIDERRQDFLRRQVRAMQTSIALLRGQRLPLADEVAAIYDVRPEWIDEAFFTDAHQTLDALLPAGGTLAERMMARRRRLEVPVDRVQSLAADVFAELRRRTLARFGLPAEEEVELRWVRDQTWSAYNWYLGDRRSLIEINTDLPFQITSLVMLLAHEAYPGHHTEHCLKETHLVRGEGRIEHSIALINSPACTVAEGIATLALPTILSDEEWVRWHDEEIFPRAGCAHLDAERERAIIEAQDRLRGVSGNAAFMLHDQGASPDEVAAYFETWALATPEEARKRLSFISAPISRSYTFTYTEGRALLEALLATHEDRDAWFSRVLNETVTPEQIRRWSMGG